MESTHPDTHADITLAEPTESAHTPHAPSDTEPLDRATIIGQDGRWITAWALRFIILCGAAFLLGIIIEKLWVGLLPVFLALLVCTVLLPIVKWLHRHKIPKALAVVLTLLGSIALISGIFSAMAPSVAKQSKLLWDQAREGYLQALDWIQGPPLNFQLDNLNTILNEITAKIQEYASNIAAGVFAGLSTASSIVVTFVVMLVLTFFFLKDGDKFLPMLRKATGPNVGWHLTEVLNRTWNTLAGYIRAQAIVSFIDSVCIGIGLLILNIPLALVLATITFFAGFIPIVGAVSAGIISVLIALVSGGPIKALIVLILILLVQQLEGHILSPIFQSKAMNIHPVLVLLSVTVGGTLFGIIGAFLAVPLAATLAVWVRYHAQLVSLRTGEITVDDIDIATTNDDPDTDKRSYTDGFTLIKDRLRMMMRKPTDDQ